MDDLDKSIKVCTLDNKKDTYKYHLSSVYISILEGATKDNINKIQYVSFLSYELEIKEISFFINMKEFKNNFNVDFYRINGEYLFPYPIVLIIHIHDMAEFDKATNDLNIYYTMNLIADKLIRSSDGNDYSLNLEKISGDDDFLFAKSEKEFNSYQIFHK